MQKILNRIRSIKGEKRYSEPYGEWLVDSHDIQISRRGKREITWRGLPHIVEHENIEECIRLSQIEYSKIVHNDPKTNPNTRGYNDGQ